VVSVQPFEEELALPDGFSPLVREGEQVEVGQVVAVRGEALALVPADEAAQATRALPAQDRVVAPIAGQASFRDGRLVIRGEEPEWVEYPLSPAARLLVEEGATVHAGDRLTEGVPSPQDLLHILGQEAVREYLVQEVQGVYRSQGVSIHDKHIEVIVRQMLRKVQVDSPGDTELLPGELVDRVKYEEINARVLAEGGEPATAQPVLLGVTKAALHTDSFLAAASFQETSRVLTEAAITGAKDRLLGLKENVIIGKLIPAGTGFKQRLERLRQKQEAALAAEQAATAAVEAQELATALLRDVAQDRAAEEAVGAPGDGTPLPPFVDRPGTS